MLLARRLGVFLTFSVAALAQSPLATVTGLATDPANAAVANASVTLTNTLTGVKRTASTNASGLYNLPNLPPGTYQLSAAAPGFGALSTEAFPVDPYRTIRQDLHFALAAATANVTVSESTSTVIAMDTASISEALTTRQLIDLPTNLRSIYDNAGDSGLIFTMLPETIPGVVQVGSGAKWITPGGVASGTRLYVDGIETDFGNFGAPDSVSQPSFESIQEFTANLLTNKAEFSGLGSINTTTKSGTNRFHGAIFGYAHNSAFDARNAFLSAKAYNNLWNYGASLGGPVIKDKTFFQFVFDGTRGARAYPVTASVPTLAQRSGDFSANAAIRNPFTGVPFPGNVIPAALLNPQALAAQAQFYPLPNFGPPTLTAGNFRGSYDGPEVHRIVEIRADHNFSDRHSAFGRYEEKKDDYLIPGARSALPPQSVGTSTNIRRVNFVTLGDVFSATPNLSNEARAGVLILASQSDANIHGQQLLTQFGITGLPDRGQIHGIPNVAISGLTTATQSLLNPVNDGHAEVSDNLTWVRGRHTAKFGADYVNWFVNRYLTTNAGLFGNFSFTNKFTGNAYSDFLLGLPTQVVRLDPFPIQYDRWFDAALYAQDDYKVLPRLTLSYGLRWEFNQPVHANNDNLYSFEIPSGSIVVPGAKSAALFSASLPSGLPITTADKVGLNRSLRHSDYAQLAPRAGFSWQVDQSARTVVRGGAGVYYTHLSANVAGDLSTGPYAISTTATNAIVNGSPLFTLGSPFGIAGGAGTLNLTAISDTLRDSPVYQYTLTVERELSKDIGLRVSYIGSHGSQLLYERNINQPYPNGAAFAQSRRPFPVFNNIIFGDNGANSSYNALQTQMQKRFTHGFLFSSAWTWAKELSEIDDNNDFELNTLIENAYDRRRDRGNVYSVPRHQWENQGLWELPLGTGALRGGWQINTLFNLVSGNFLNPQFAGTDPSGTNNVGGRPNAVAPITYPKALTQWFNASAFAVPASGFGTAARNSIEGPGYVLFNAGVSKRITIEHLGAVQAGATFQNILNHLNPGEPNTGINNANAGVITATHVFPPAGSPRTGQVFLRFTF